MAGCDSRNTALGASSPANPALHIPELQRISHERQCRLPVDESLMKALQSALEDEDCSNVYWGVREAHTHCR